MDELDKQIVQHLHEDGRKSFREIADAVDTTPVTVTNRVQKLQERGIIKDYTVRLDHEQLGLDLAAIIRLEVNGDRDRLQDRLDDHAFVQSMYRVTGDTDVVILGKFPDQQELSDFVKYELLDHDESVVETANTHIIMDTYKEDHAVPPTDHAPS